MNTCDRHDGPQEEMNDPRPLIRRRIAVETTGGSEVIWENPNWVEELRQAGLDPADYDEEE